MDLIFALTTITLIILLLYVRLDRSTLIIRLTEDEIIKYLNVFFWLLVCHFIFFMVIVVLIKKNKRGYLGNKINEFITKLQKYNIVYFGYEVIIEWLASKYIRSLVILAQKVVALSNKQCIAIILSFITLPRILITLILITEIFFFQKLHYYFYSLLLLIFPLIFRLIIFFFKDLGPRLLPAIKNALIFTESTVSKEINDLFPEASVNQISINLKPEYSEYDLNDYLYTFYYPITFLISKMEVNILPKYTIITLYTLLGYYFIHVFCWSYILFF